MKFLKSIQKILSNKNRKPQALCACTTNYCHCRKRVSALMAKQ